MNKFTKIAAGTLAALTITVGTLATSTTEAQAFPKKGLGFALGAIGAAAFIAATGPRYYGYGPGCRWVARYDVWGNYRGSVKVCDLY
jgi:hypothetical protein